AQRRRQCRRVAPQALARLALAAARAAAGTVFTFAPEIEPVIGPAPEISALGGEGAFGRGAALEDVEHQFDLVEHQMRDTVEAGLDVGGFHSGRLQCRMLTRHPEVRARSASLEGRRPSILRGAANAAHLRMTEFDWCVFHSGRLHRCRGMTAAGCSDQGPGPKARWFGEAPAKSEGRRRAKRRGPVSMSRPLEQRAWRLSARRPAFMRRRAALSDAPLRPASGSKFAAPFGSTARPKPRAGLRGPPSASSSRGVVVPPGGTPAPPGRVSLLRSRPRAPARTPRAGATGSRPLGGS